MARIGTRWVLGSLLLILAALGCGEKKADGGGSGQIEKPADPSSGKRADSVTFDDRQVHWDLVSGVFLADIRDGGALTMTFGSPARNKYTSGDWRSGFVEDGVSGKDQFSLVGDTVRVAFHVDEPGALTLRLRVRPVGGKNLALYLNNKTLPSVKMTDGPAFQEHEITVPAEVVERGENQLLLRFGGTQKVNGKDVGAALASIRVSPAPVALPMPSSFAELARVETSPALGTVLRVPAGRTLSYYVEVPPDAELGVGLASAAKGKAGELKVTLQPEGGDAQEVLSAKSEDDRDTEAVSLAKWKGEVVRVDVAARGAEVLVGPLALLVPKVEPKEIPPLKNVVVLLIDTLRAERLKAYTPNSRVKTPVIDGLAEAGTVFEHAQSPENWTKPSTASILTSLYPVTHGAKTDAARVPEKAVLLSEHLKGKGFRTGSFIANGYVSDKFGFAQGWDHYTNHIREKKSTEAKDVFAAAGDWIERNKDQRFFAYVHTIDPHVPYDPPDEFLKMYDPSEYTGPVKPRLTPDQLEKAKRSPPAMTFTEADKRRLLALHDGEISYHDRELGVFIERLKSLGVWEDTLLVITADHGEEFNEHGSWGHGHSVYQELLHVPFIVHAAGKVPAMRVPNTVGTVDVAPTALDLLGVDPLPYFEGKSLTGYMRGAPPAGPSVGFSDFLDDRRVIRAGRWKVILRGINIAFFDLEKDPMEQKELARAAFPIAYRYARILQGQFLGAKDLSRWLDPTALKAGLRFDTEEAQMDDAIKAQLKALGYAN